jgi:hypothetical protein
MSQANTFGKPCDHAKAKAIDAAAKEFVEHNNLGPVDMVNNPPYYKVFPDAEAIDIIESALTPEEFAGYLKGNALKYRLRAGDKGDMAQDIDKANWYKRRLFNGV